MKPLMLFISVVLTATLSHAGQPLPPEFDSRGGAVYEGYGKMNEAYRSGGSSERTLQEYYSRRQYPGSPPFIPHVAEEKFGEEVNCLSCHGAGGWAEQYERHTPVTPHPEMAACRQCHVPRGSGELFRETEWVSVPPPRLGGSAMPGSPPPVPHRLQMRENCLACHAGPGAVASIRSEHAGRGNCRQCHVSRVTDGLFERMGP